jgi:hypothetical protein
MEEKKRDYRTTLGYFCVCYFLLLLLFDPLVFYRSLSSSTSFLCRSLSAFASSLPQQEEEKKGGQKTKRTTENW